MKCSECEKVKTCYYAKALSEMMHGHKGLYTSSFAGLVSDTKAKYDRFMDWYDSFADYCPHYKYQS